MVLSRQTSEGEATAMSDWGWITSRLAVGSEPSRSDIPAMHRAGITDVLDLRGEPRAHETSDEALYVGTGIRYHYVPMLDRGGREPVEKYVEGVQVILDALARPGTKILTQCAAGENRSPSMAYAYLRAIGFSPQDAWDAVKSGRPEATRQYVPSAEAAVPYLPRTPSRMDGEGVVLGALLIGGAAAFVTYWLFASR